MKKSETLAIFLMSLAIHLLRVVTKPIEWFADLCFELAMETNERF